MKVFINCWYRNIMNHSFMKSLTRINVDGVELSIDYPLLFTQEIPDVFIDAMHREGLKVGLHLPWREVFLASPVSEIRRLSERIISGIVTSVASKLDPLYFVVHLSTNQSWCGPKDRLCLEAASKSLETLSQLSDELGIPLLVETVTDRCCSNEERLPYLLMRADPGKIGVCLDIPHIIERRVKRWKVLHNPLTIVNDLPPIMLEHTKVVHIHGVHVPGPYTVLTHVVPSEEFLRELMQAIRSHVPHAGVGVLEIFKDITGRDINIRELRWIVSYVRGGDLK